MIGRRLARALLAALDQERFLGRKFAAHGAFVAKQAFRLTLLVYPFFAVASWMRLGWRKLLRRGPRTVYGPTPIISISDQVKVLRTAGMEAESLVFTTYFITSDFDHNLFPLVSNPATVNWFPNVLFLWSLLRYDVYDFFYDGGLWSGMKIVPKAKWIELPLLRLAGKRVIMTAYGADVRVKSINERWNPNICAECPAPGKHCICTDDSLKNARHAADWANVAIAMGDMFDFVPGARLTPNHWPIDTDKVPFVGTLAHDGPVVIAHSPNHREFKGTRFLLDAVEELQRRGHDVRVDMIERVSNVEARDRYSKADIIFCQCLAGWMGFTEIEGMAFGKPVITYLRNDDYLAHSPGFPAVSAPPERLVDELERLVVDPVGRQERGLASRKWVEDNWSYRALAPQLRDLHLEVWKRNGLVRTLRTKRDDLRAGRGRWASSVPSTWNRRVTAPPVTLDLDRLGGILVGFRSAPAVQASIAAMLRTVATSADSGQAVRALIDQIVTRRVDCGASLAFTTFHALRELPDDDPELERLLVHLTSVVDTQLPLAGEGAPDNAVDTTRRLLDAASLAVALCDATTFRPGLETGERRDRLMSVLRSMDGVDWSAPDPRPEFEQRFLLAAMLQALSAATADHSLSASAEELRTTTGRLARRAMLSLEGTW